MVSTLTHRAKVVCTGPELLTKELQHLRRALTQCKYPKWALDKVERKLFNNWEHSNTQGDNPEEGTSNPSGTTTGRDPNKEKQSKGHIVIPYTKRLGESIKKICSKYEIQTHFKRKRTIKQILAKPKGKDPMDKKSGAIYYYQCGELTCNEEYIGETSRTFGERFKEHLKDPSPIQVHSTKTGNSTTQENFNIIGREDHGLARTIKNLYSSGSTTPHLTEMWVSIISIIYGTESCPTPLTLKLIMTMGMHTEHPLVGMLSPFQPIGIPIEP